MGNAAPEIVMLAGSVLAGMAAPQGQKLKSFEGSATDPRDMSHNAKELINMYLSQTEDNVAKGTHFDTTVNPLPSFVGKGLPMTIGAPGQDLRRIPRRTLAPPAGPVTKLPDTPTDGEPPPTLHGTGTPSGMIAGLTGGEGMDQAAAALELLKKQYQG